MQTIYRGDPCRRSTETPGSWVFQVEAVHQPQKVGSCKYSSIYGAADELPSACVGQAELVVRLLHSGVARLGEGRRSLREHRPVSRERQAKPGLQHEVRNSHFVCAFEIIP